jgi:ATP-dependent protease ClpP protease subunit
MNWFSVEHKSDGAHVNIFAEIGSFGIRADALLSELGDTNTVYLRIDSPGGNGNDAMKLYKVFSGLDTDVTITNRCHSAALIIAMAGKRIKCSASAVLLVHPSSTYVLGNAAILRCAADNLQILDSECDEIIAARTRKPIELIRQWSGKETRFTADEALVAGLVDEIFTAPDAPSAPSAPAIVASDTPTVETISDEEQIIDAVLSSVRNFKVANLAVYRLKIDMLLSQRVTDY